MIQSGPALRAETLLAIQAVRDALDFARHPISPSDVSAKDGRDVVTTADIAIEDKIRTQLEELFGFPVIGEERGGSAPADGTPYWLVDPICGTRNFASGTPLYCVNLALIEQDRVAAGIVGDPSRDEVVVAELGTGAWAMRDGAATKLRASTATRTVVVETGGSTGLRREAAANFAGATIRADQWDFRSLGSTLCLPYLAGGRISAYIVFLVTAVHSAAGSLLVTEAGGTVSDIDGKPWTLESDSILATADAQLHSQLLELAR